MRAKFTTSLVVDDGTTKQLQSTGLRSQQAQDDPDLQLVQLVLDPSHALLSLDGRARMGSGDETTPGGKAKERASEWLSGGVEIGRSDSSEESVTIKLKSSTSACRRCRSRVDSSLYEWVSRHMKRYLPGSSLSPLFL